MTAATRSGQTAQTFEAPELDAAIAATEETAVVIHRGERIAFADVPGRIASIDGRGERNALYASWVEAVEAINPRYVDRFAQWSAAGREVPPDLGVAGEGVDLGDALDGFTAHSETEYYAALRRYLAAIGIEQGDATLADLWHIERGAAWSQWFGGRDVSRALRETRRGTDAAAQLLTWQDAQAQLRGLEAPDAQLGAEVVAELYAWLVGDPAWLAGALRMADDEVAAFADFAAFIRLSRLRRLVGLVEFERRLLASDDESVNRAYYAGMVGHITGIEVPEAAYLREVRRPGSSAAALVRALLAGAAAEALEQRFGPSWWSSAEARSMVAEIAATSTVADVLAQIGYDALHWRPVMRQIRTRLIGEMSGYGGPNITTRAGTRKV